jgi:hypothetical protein
MANDDGYNLLRYAYLLPLCCTVVVTPSVQGSGCLKLRVKCIATRLRVCHHQSHSRNRTLHSSENIPTIYLKWFGRLWWLLIQKFVRTFNRRARQNKLSPLLTKAVHVCTMKLVCNLRAPYYCCHEKEVTRVSIYSSQAGMHELYWVNERDWSNNLETQTQKKKWKSWGVKRPHRITI